jgi:hypothetical protein
VIVTTNLPFSEWNTMFPTSHPAPILFPGPPTADAPGYASREGVAPWPEEWHAWVQA